MKTQFSALLASATVVTGTVVTMMVAPAQAFTGICQNDQVTYTSGANQIAASACRGEIETEVFGNDVERDGNPLLSRLNSLFGTNYNWSFVGKDEANINPNQSGGFDGYVGGDAKSGAWSVTNPITGPFAISVKASTGFAVYLFENISEASSILGGNWSTAGLRVDGGQGSQPGLSHISLFTAQRTPDRTPVPEPASLVGLGLFASGMVMARRRRSVA